MSEPPLPTLLSQVLVAYTIEFDNEFESRMPHRTAAGEGPWLVERDAAAGRCGRAGS